MARTTVDVPCGLCGLPVSRTPSQLRHYPNAFHPECRGKGISDRLREVALARPKRHRTEEQKQRARDTLGVERRRQVTRPCSVPGCMETVTRKASEMKYAHVFCDLHTTQRQYVEKVTKPCETCGRLNEYLPSQIRDQEHFFCPSIAGERPCVNGFIRDREPMLEWNPAPEVAAYCAGGEDGDGSIDIAEGDAKPQLRARLGVTDLPVLEWMKSIFPGTCELAPRSGTKPGHKPMYDLTFMGNQAYTFVKAIEPYLRLKKAEARRGLAFQVLAMRHRTKSIMGQAIRAEWEFLKTRRHLHPELPPVTLPYVAGLFDTEGSIGLGNTPQYCCLTVSISNTVQWLMEDIHQWQPQSSIQEVHPHHDNWHDAWVWRCYTTVAEELLRAMLPYLHIKARRAELALKYTSMYYLKERRTPQALSILAEFDALNKRGT